MLFRQGFTEFRAIRPSPCSLSWYAEFITLQRRPELCQSLSPSVHGGL